MKLATYHDGSRDGQLVVVSRDGHSAHFAHGIAGTLRQVLDDWNFLSPQLEDLSTTLNHGKARHAFPFEPARCMAPLPRASALFEPAPVAATSAPDAPVAPALHALPPDGLWGPTAPATFGAEAWGIAALPSLAVATGDIDAGASAAQGQDGVRLVLLAAAWSLQRWGEADAARGQGRLRARPATSFAPVALTPDELGPAWSAGAVRLALQMTQQGRRAGTWGADEAMAWPFGALIALLCATRGLQAGSLVLAGPPPAAIARSTREPGEAAAPAGLAFGDTWRAEARDADGANVFGTIAQRVTGPGGQAAGSDDHESDPERDPDSSADDDPGAAAVPGA